MVAPVGTVAEICVSEVTANAAFVPLKETLVAVVKLSPVMTTGSPTLPPKGEKPVMMGASPLSTKLLPLVAVPVGVVTERGPVVAVVGTVA